jgi:predicted outer membrane lipoprotein
MEAVGLCKWEHWALHPSGEVLADAGPQGVTTAQWLEHMDGAKLGAGGDCRKWLGLNCLGQVPIVGIG